MSRVAKNPVTIPSGVEVQLATDLITVKGKLGELKQAFSTNRVQISQTDNALAFAPKDKKRDDAMAGTLRAVVDNMVTGVSSGFKKELKLVGVGYRAKVQGKALNLTVGFSHPVDFTLPEGITAETPSQTDIVVKGADKQQVMQIAANIRAVRPPEPYKGKGIRYVDERVVLKEAKKK